MKGQVGAHSNEGHCNVRVKVCNSNDTPTEVRLHDVSNQQNGNVSSSEQVLSASLVIFKFL